jgi:hypothetical protein
MGGQQRGVTEVVSTEPPSTGTPTHRYTPPTSPSTHLQAPLAPQCLHTFRNAPRQASPGNSQHRRAKWRSLLVFHAPWRFVGHTWHKNFVRLRRIQRADCGCLAASARQASRFGDRKWTGLYIIRYSKIRRRSARCALRQSERRGHTPR